MPSFSVWIVTVHNSFIVCKLHVVSKEKGVQVLVYKVKVHAGVVA